MWHSKNKHHCYYKSVWWFYLCNCICLLKFDHSSQKPEKISLPKHAGFKILFVSLQLVWNSTATYKLILLINKTRQAYLSSLVGHTPVLAHLNDFIEGNEANNFVCLPDSPIYIKMQVNHRNLLQTDNSITFKGNLSQSLLLKTSAVSVFIYSW